jgi:hypothetical protein
MLIFYYIHYSLLYLRLFLWWKNLKKIPYGQNRESAIELLKKATNPLRQLVEKLWTNLFYFFIFLSHSSSALHSAYIYFRVVFRDVVDVD